MTKKELLLEMQNRRDIGEYVGPEALLCIFDDDEQIDQPFIDLMFTEPKPITYDFFMGHDCKKQFEKELEEFIKVSIN